MKFAQQYGPWGLVAGASEGVGLAFARALAERGLNVVLLARRKNVLEEIRTEIEQTYGVQTRSLAIDLSHLNATDEVMAAVSDIEIGFFIYCAGGDAHFKAFLEAPLEDAESMVFRNCLMPVQLSHQLGRSMAERGQGAIVILGSGAGFAGAKNMAAYGASKAFDMVFAEALWCELKPKGVDVLGLILGETDTPALRRLRYKRGLTVSVDEPVRGAETAEYVVKDALENLSKGPTRLANRKMRWGLKLLYPFSRNFVVSLMTKANEKVMGKD